MPRVKKPTFTIHMNGQPFASDADTCQAVINALTAYGFKDQGVVKGFTYETEPELPMADGGKKADGSGAKLK